MMEIISLLRYSLRRITHKDKHLSSQVGKFCARDYFLDANNFARTLPVLVRVEIEILKLLRKSSIF